MSHQNALLSLIKPTTAKGNPSKNQITFPIKNVSFVEPKSQKNLDSNE